MKGLWRECIIKNCRLLFHHTRRGMADISLLMAWTETRLGTAMPIETEKQLNMLIAVMLVAAILVLAGLSILVHILVR